MLLLARSPSKGHCSVPVQRVTTSSLSAQPSATMKLLQVLLPGMALEML
jgi:hypothetical protein